MTGIEQNAQYLTNHSLCQLSVTSQTFQTSMFNFKKVSFMLNFQAFPIVVFFWPWSMGLQLFRGRNIFLSLNTQGGSYIIKLCGKFIYLHVNSKSQNYRNSHLEIWYADRFYSVSELTCKARRRKIVLENMTTNIGNKKRF